MRSLLLPTVSLGAALTLIGQPAQDPTAAPPLQLELRVDGRAHRVTAGEAATIEIGGREHELVVRALPNRTFRAGGVSFAFPADMSFEYDGSDGLQMWTLDGNDLTILVYRFADGDPMLLAREVLDATLEGLDSDSRIGKVGLRVGGESREALTARFEALGTTIDVVGFGVSVGGAPCVVMLQDTLSDEGESSAEMRRMRTLLDETFRVEAR